VEKSAVWTRNLLILACCLAPSSVRAAWGNGLENAEFIPAPAASSAQMSAPLPGDMPCDAAYTPLPTPWFYWWLSYRGRGQHYAYPPPVPGSYYFRPYSLAQLRAQQQAAQDWGGDPRNPYSNKVFQQIYPKKAARPVSSYR
jgi:hypothetical protein